MTVDRVLGLGAVCLAAPVLLVSWSYGVGRFTAPGAGFWPFYVALAMLALAASLILHPGAGAARAAAGSRWGKFGIGLATLVFYVIALEPLGYLCTTTGLLLAQLRWVEGRTWRGSILTAVAAAGVSLLVFRALLRVPLPLGVLSLPKGW